MATTTQTNKRLPRRPRGALLPALALLLLAASLVPGPCQAAAAAQRGPKCGPEREQEMEACAAKLGFLGNHDFVVPKNSSSMDAFCLELKRSIGCIQAYSRECLAGFTRQLMTSLLKRGKQQHTTICQSDQSRAEFMTKMGCITDDKIDKFHATMDGSVARFEYISGKAPADSKLVSLCCSYQIFRRDLDSALEQICAKRPQRAATRSASGGSINEFLHKIVAGTTGEFMSLICDSHQSLADCRASSKTNQVLPALEEVTKRVYEGRLKPAHKSIIPVLLEILDGAPA